MTHEKNEAELRARKLRDKAAVVSFVAPIIVVIGLIGKFYVDGYRLSQHEDRIKELAIENRQFSSQVRSIELIEFRIKYIEDRLRRIERR